MTERTEVRCVRYWVCDVCGIELRITDIDIDKWLRVPIPGKKGLAKHYCPKHKVKACLRKAK